MALLLPRDCVTRMYEHAQTDYPHECCGILVGRIQNGDRRVERIVESPNIEQSRMHDRFLLDPGVHARTYRELRGTDQDVLGYYHSHPDHPCRPSQTDFEFASMWPDHAFLIVEVRDRKAVAHRSWVVPDGGDAFVEESVEVLA